ncbi:Gfo/Idh/MocA family oxidoreductase [Paenibacillus sp. HWE-109]|uniref:Gfo/Idh/MocA family protein n=1 Tax=Paenibacillus sp. HWE-109 TaxID=1306526 RepID=UPI001EDEB7F0|nr:Gfo/Idh/MocA family oxidoreductase [Paenibacillus sp. HWE-109]UKS27837.1 Gfo/Idh/MocA family oxidoreductase [Paenibacillus sp. HWE-109]
MTKLRWGILGCANIAIRACIPGIRQSQTGIVSAIASRSLQKSQEKAAELDIPKAYGSYEELIADPDIDAIYIPLPNHLHKEWTIRAVQAGKHVLCEKPAALTAAEVQEMVTASEQAGVQFAEAFMYRHHPRYDRIKAIIDSGEIGDVRGIHGAFTFSNPGDSKNVRYVREWGGGSAYDVGCYPLSAARLILGREPEAVTTHAFFSPEHDHVDMMMSGLVEFSGNVALTFDCGMWAGFRNTLEIVGAIGRIEVPSAFVTPTEESGHFIVQVGNERREEKVPFLNQYALQADDLAYAAWGEKAARFPASDAVLNMKLIDACLQSARERSRIVMNES